jgi:hypothetical protein
MRADEKLTAFLELERAIYRSGDLSETLTFARMS